MKKLAVFDLDGTLYSKNSHIEILSKYYNTNYYNTLICKILFKFFPVIMLKYLNYKYERIPLHIKETFLLPFRKSALKLLEEKRSAGYKIKIISNAPYLLIKNAAKILNVEFAKAQICRKSEILLSEKYDFLFVCTDNITDIDLLEIADEQYIYINEKTKKYFKKYFKKAILLRE